MRENERKKIIKTYSIHIFIEKDIFHAVVIRLKKPKSMRNY